MADERVEQYPDVPTLKEQGVDWTMTAWRGVCVPVDTPPEIRAYLVRALERVALGDTFHEFMGNSGFNATWKADEAFREHMRDVRAARRDGHRSGQRARFALLATHAARRVSRR